MGEPTIGIAFQHVDSWGQAVVAVELDGEGAGLTRARNTAMLLRQIARRLEAEAASLFSKYADKRDGGEE
jgi:hypothetical protein